MSGGEPEQQTLEQDQMGPPLPPGYEYPAGGGWSGPMALTLYTVIITTIVIMPVVAVIPVSMMIMMAEEEAVAIVAVAVIVDLLPLARMLVLDA